MNRFACSGLMIVLLGCSTAAGQTPAVAPLVPKAAAVETPARIVKVQSGKAADTKENLHYDVNWPSGLSLGEVTLQATHSAEGLVASFFLQASVPGFSVEEKASTKSNSAFCSVEFEKTFLRGKRQGSETTTFEPGKLSAKRSTKGGGTSEIAVPQCPRDALTYLYHVRKELAAGRLPQMQKVFYGAGYDATLQFSGVERIQVGGESIEAEKLTLTLKGPASENTAELYFARDAVRTPLLIRVPLAMGKFSMELSR
jgi:hypothetical protein